MRAAGPAAPAEPAAPVEVAGPETHEVHEAPASSPSSPGDAPAATHAAAAPAAEAHAVEAGESPEGARPASAACHGNGDQSGILSLTRALDAGEGDAEEALAVPASVLPPDAPVAEASADRDNESEGDRPADRAERSDEIGEVTGAAAADDREVEEPAPSPLNALDALGALDPVHVSLVSRREERGEAMADAAADTAEDAAEEAGDAEEAAPDPAAQFQTIFRQAVLDEVREHAESQDKVEVCGVLVGSVYENSTGAFCYVEGCIRGSYAAGGTAQVTFTAETWQHIDREMDARFPGRKIVGWYHTHPGFGIFLSEMDLFIQRHFFNAPWQTALVYDPQSKERGLFGWDGSEIVRQTFVLDNEIGPAVTEAAGPNLSPKPHALEEGPAGGPPGSAAELTTRIKVLEQRQRYMLVGMAAVMLVAVIWPLVVLVVMNPGDGAAGSGGGGGTPQVTPSPALDHVDHAASSVTQGVDSATAGVP